MLEKIKQVRQSSPKAGCRKIKNELKGQGTFYGRDRMFKLLRKEDMLIKPKKRFINTTESFGTENRYENLLKQRLITAPDQVYVADTTYLRTSKGFRYLSHVMDAYSRNIIGYAKGCSNDAELCIKAMEMALKARKGSKAGIIHHSDQGSTYGSNKYKELLEKHGIIQSMSRRGNPYDNAMAERVIGTLKREYFLGEKFRDVNFLDLLIDQAIKLYNGKRLHMSLNYKTPDEVYYGKVESKSSQATPSWIYLT